MGYLYSTYCYLTVYLLKRYKETESPDSKIKVTKLMSSGFTLQIEKTNSMQTVRKKTGSELRE